MNLQGLGKVETYETYLDMAFKNGKNATVRAKAAVKTKDKTIKSRWIELARIESITKSLASSMDFLLKSFPQVDELDPFYQELIKATIDYDLFKKSLGALVWAKKQVIIMHTKYKREIQRARLQNINSTRTAFSGRISSVMKQIKTNLQYLDECRKIMKSYPALKTKRNTIVIAGAPNVGKSTLLAVLTGSKPATASYPFTTQKINLGYDTKGNQYVDTPGLLDRPLSKRNKIERQAILALKHLADIIIFVIDPTEACGYTIPQQKNLLLDLKKEFKQPIILTANKADTGATYKNAIMISAKEGKIEELKKELNLELDKKAKQEDNQE